MKKTSENWIQYKCIDAGDFEKLENWNGVIIRRPESQANWKTNKKTSDWLNPDASYDLKNKIWNYNKPVNEYWKIQYKELTFKISLTDFKHTGLFPEQAVNWEFMMDKIKKSGRKIKVLNLFAYTGGATMACSLVGAEVVHVDASKGMVQWAKENMVLSNLQNNKIRFIVDDCIKFVEREIRRGNKYDAIIMDPPAYGKGPRGESWKFENNIEDLIKLCCQLLSDKPLFLLVNAYKDGVSSSFIKNILENNILKKFSNGKVIAGEIGLPIEKQDLILPCGIYGRWESVNEK